MYNLNCPRVLVFFCLLNMSTQIYNSIVSVLEIYHTGLPKYVYTDL